MEIDKLTENIPQMLVMNENGTVGIVIVGLVLFILSLFSFHQAYTRRTRGEIVFAVLVFMTNSLFGFLATFDFNKKVEWEKTVLSHYINSIPNTKTDFESAVILGDYNEKAKFVKVLFKNGKTYEGIAIIKENTGDNTIIYKKREDSLLQNKDLKHYFKNPYLMLEIHTEKNILNADENIKEMVVEKGNYYPGVTSSSLYKWWIIQFLVVVLYAIFWFAAKLTLLTPRRESFEMSVPPPQTPESEPEPIEESVLVNKRIIRK